jgi:hypothetical protein
MWRFVSAVPCLTSAVISPTSCIAGTKVIVAAGHGVGRDSPVGIETCLQPGMDPFIF